jgi:predicted MFS family arabinose efflux permease
MLTSRSPRKPMILLLMSAFVAGHVLDALATGYEMLMTARIAISFTHGTFVGLAAIIAVSLVSDEKRGRAIAVVLGGFTVANVLGVPAGTAVGNALGWRNFLDRRRPWPPRCRGAIYLLSGGLPAMAILMFAFGATNFALAAALQTRILKGAEAAPDLASTLISSVFNLGIAAGSAVGAVALDNGFSYAQLRLPMVAFASPVQRLPSNSPSASRLKPSSRTSPNCPSRTCHARTAWQWLPVGACANSQGHGISQLQTSNQSPASRH